MLYSIIRANMYQDSLRLMHLSRALNGIAGIDRVSIVMGTPGKVVRSVNSYLANRINAMLYHRNGTCYAKGDHRAWEGAAFEAQRAEYKQRFEREFAEKYPA